MGFPNDVQSASQTGDEQNDRPPADAKPARTASFCWVPIRSLGERHRERILEHLLALDSTDRYLRFGFPASDEQVAAYAAKLDFERDELFGIFNRRLALVGNAHLAFPSAAQNEGEPPMAEFGVSVLAHVRGRGFGARMFENALLRARNRGVDTLFIHALSENAAMLHIARKAGATVQRDGAESRAWLKLPPEDFASRVGELFDEHAGELDYQLKAHAQQVQPWIGLFRKDN